MSKLDFTQWVKTEENPSKKLIKKAIHIIILAISSNPRLHDIMILKGGVLIDLAFNSKRYTTDIDFSSGVAKSDFNESLFFTQLDDSLLEMSTSVLGEYGLLCKCQSHQWNPRRTDATFPALKVRIAYADRMDPKSIKRLERGLSLDVIEIDYSFNEPLFNIKLAQADDLGTVQIYSIFEVISEKIRSILQQEMRNRYRRQDVFDLNHLISTHTFSIEDKTSILDSLIKKCVSRDITPDALSLENPEIMRRAEDNYGQLAPEILGSLPNFDDAYNIINTFYKSLPWPTSFE